MFLNTVHGTYGNRVVDSKDGSGNVVQGQQLFGLAVAGFIIASAKSFIILGATGDSVQLAGEDDQDGIADLIHFCYKNLPSCEITGIPIIQTILIPREPI